MKIDKQKAIVLLTPVVKTMLKNEIIISNIYDANHAKEFASNVVDYMEDMEDTIDESKSKRMKLKSILTESSLESDITAGFKKIVKTIQSITSKDQVPGCEKLIKNWYNMISKKFGLLGLGAMYDSIKKYQPDTRLKELKDYLDRKIAEL